MVTNEVILEEIGKLRSDLTVLLAASESRLLLEIQGLNRRINEVVDENGKLKNRIELLEKKNRKNNVVIFGLSSFEGDIKDHITANLKSLLGIELNVDDFNNVYRVGGVEGPIIVEFLSYLKKLEVFRHTAKLKGRRIYNI